MSTRDAMSKAVVMNPILQRGRFFDDLPDPEHAKGAALAVELVMTPATLAAYKAWVIGRVLSGAVERQDGQERLRWADTTLENLK